MTIVNTSQLGTFAVYNRVTASQVGVFRVANDIGGYNVYVGTGSLPDLTQPPEAFSATLPISVPLTPPLSGTETFYIIVRRQDHYGLESQNQFATTFLLNTAGTLVLPPIQPPQGLLLNPLTGGKVRLNASNPQYGHTHYPANYWKVWLSVAVPNPSVDTPVAVVQVTGKTLTLLLGPYTAGIYHVAVALYRTNGGDLSAVLSGTVVIPAAPAPVVPVPGGW